MADGDSASPLTARTIGRIADVAAPVWDALANPPETSVNPFVSHAFLTALENSGSATAETGWAPAHILAERDGAAIAAAPVYVKSHSYGEYVFDHHWADAFERAGGRYFPKVLCAAPFTPVPGPRLLATTAEAKRIIAATLIELAQQAGASSVHVNFIDLADAELLDGGNYFRRDGIQYHWFNRGYASFEDFLGDLSSRKRKAIRRERRDAAEGLEIRRLSGAEISADIWEAFWGFYQDTGGRKWGRPYLTRAFFEEIAETMADRILMVVAFDGTTPIAGALNFIGGDALYGRYWGRTEERPFLHFEVCYYQAIEFAIERRLGRVEAGAQGEHKIARGYRPVATHSAHWIANPRFREAVVRHVAGERQAIAAEIDYLDQMTPFRREGGS